MIKKIIIWAAGAAFFTAIIYLVVLAVQITSKFEYHRWNLPSRVYSDSFSLYPGRPLTAADLKEKLINLSYRAVAQDPREAGQYNQQGAVFTIYLNDFAYPHEKFEGHPVELSLEENRITSLDHGTTGEAMPYARLEPELIASLFDEKMEDRTFVPMEKIPDTLVKAVIAIEDERFYSHWGIDPMGISRAFVANVKTRNFGQGGSTLTQQLIKNLYLNAEKSLARKVNEAAMALIMELRYSKEEILEAYLNEIYLGQRGNASIAGVEEAARHYFAKRVGQLDTAECALLAGIIRSPGLYSPFAHPDRAKARRNTVLEKLRKKKWITETQYKTALKTSLPEKPPNRRAVTAPYFIDYVKRQLKDNFGDKLTQDGLRIFSTLEMNWQRQAEEAVERDLKELEKGHPRLKQNAAQGKPLEGALVSLEPGTGFIRAYVGGRDYSNTQFDRLSDSLRQPGSAFKPFVYLTALSPERSLNPFTLASLLDDNPLTIDMGGRSWKPQNYDKTFHGAVPLKESLAKSYNTATVWLSLQVGLDQIIQTARDAGITTPLEDYPSLSLGAFEIKPLELASAYTVFPNQGSRTEPVAVRQVVTPEGEVLEKRGFDMKPVFSEDAIALMNRALQEVVNHGTATSVRTRGFTAPAAGKTGTTSDYRDSWFVGYTPDLVTLSWVGYDDNTPTGLSGSSGALPLWTDFMKKAAPKAGAFPFSDKILLVAIDKKTGLLYQDSCSERIDEYFIEGTEPQGFCND